MTEIRESEFDIEKIADSGQCFRMKKLPGDGDHNKDALKYEIIARDRRVIVTQFPGSFVLDCTENEYESFWKSYFDIDTDMDYEMIRSLVDLKDEYLTKAVNTGYGIRILRQDLWEMIVTFLISQQNNIPRIHKCIENICREYGRYIEVSDSDALDSETLDCKALGCEVSDCEVSDCDASDCNVSDCEVSDFEDSDCVRASGKESHFDDVTGNILRQNAPVSGYYAFPTPESLAHLDEDDLMSCNLGYRSKYVVRAARSVVEGSLDLEAISRMDYPEAREELLKIYGVGAKVADCICLFGLHHLEAFPVDTHIRQVLEREYGSGLTGGKEASNKRDTSGLRSFGVGTDFPFERYGKYAGVIQQYIFYYELHRPHM